MISFGNSIGDCGLVEYVTPSGATGFAALVLHDDASREYAYSPAQGLGISYNIANWYGGRIWVKSAVGHHFSFDRMVPSFV